MQKMRKLALALGAAIGLGAGAAHAQFLPITSGNDTYGSALVVPYYTVQNGNVTLLNLVNADPTLGKAVKIRFRGSERSDDVFDFQVFLSPSDMWTANISRGADGRAQLSTLDNSCTLPADVNRPFETLRLPGATAAVKAAGTREGYVEIIAMGDIIPDGTSQQTELFTATKHVNGVAPCTSNILQSIVSGNVNNLNADNDENGAAARLGSVVTPLLYANATIINVEEAAAWGFNAVPLDNPLFGLLSEETETRYWSQTASPFTGDLTQVTLDGVFLSGAVTPAQYDFPDLSTPRYDEMSPPEQYEFFTLFGIGMSPILSNEFITDPDIFASTDWLFSMPTRRYAVEGRPYEGGVAHADAADLGDDGGRGVLEPFAEYYDEDTGCIVMPEIEVFDREERTVTTGVVVSPGETSQPLLCGEVVVMSFNRQGATQSGALGAELTLQDLTVPYQDGHATLWFDTESLYGGVPIIAMSFIKANSGGSGATNMNFGGVWKHRGFSFYGS